MGTERKFLTFQTVQRYEAALFRHAQFCRWTRVFICPCVTSNTNQPDIHCPICKGRGEIYKSPGPFFIIDEVAPHDNLGLIKLKHAEYVPGSVTVYKTNTLGKQYTLELALVQPLNKRYIQLADPRAVAPYERLYVNYQFNPNKKVVAENCPVVKNNVLYANGTKVEFKGRSFNGSVSEVTRVYNITKNQPYTVTGFSKQYIYLLNMGTYSPGDVLEVDYSYQEPYPFLIHSLSQKKRYESAYVIDQADAVCQSSYYYDIRPNDLVTSLAMELPGSMIVDPRVSGPSAPDTVSDAFDIAKLTGLVDSTGREYNINTDVSLLGRNELVWNIPKPLTRYTVQYLYNPTFVGLTTYDTARFSENKSFVNRINVSLRDKMNKEVSF